jgi:hypothetical protein
MIHKHNSDKMHLTGKIVALCGIVDADGAFWGSEGVTTALSAALKVVKYSCSPKGVGKAALLWGTSLS